MWLLVPFYSGSSLGDLPKDACDELGFLLQCTSQAVESAVKPQRVYVCMFNEAYVAVHFHVFPRMNWMKDFSSDFGRSGTLIDGGIVFSAARRAKADPAVILEAEAQIVAAAATIRKFVGEAMGSRLASQI